MTEQTPDLTAEPATRIPARPWADVATYVNETWLPDSAPHHAIIAQTRAGKSSLIRHGLLPLVPHDRVLMLDSKGGTDPAWHGWGREVHGMPSALTLRAHDNGEPRTHWYRLILDTNPKGRGRARDAAGDALQTVLSSGRWIVVIDETRHVTDPREPGLGLRSHFESLLLRGGSSGVMVLMGTQAPRWVPSSVYDQASFAWIGRVRDEVAHKRLLEIGGMSKSLLPVIASTPRYSWTVNADGGDWLARTKPPAPPKRDPEQESDRS
jgi:hypothetical protein